MKYWVTHQYFKPDTGLLAQMEQFATSIQSSRMMTKLATGLRSAIAERVWFRYFHQRLILSYCFLSYLQLISASMPNGTITHKPTRTNESRGLAIALLILAGDKYTRILPADYISYFQQQPGENAVRDILETNHAISCWVQHTILFCDDLEGRSDLLAFFLYAAEVTGYVNVCLSPGLIPTFAGIP